MNMYDLIVKKKRGGALAKDEIDWMIREYTDGRIPDYQMSAMMMAVCFVGMTDEETKDLTLAMAHSGDVLDLSAIHGIKVDKHSTGGVGDKTSLVLAPLVASLGVPVAKMSGRGLGHTGGTIDKLESFTGFHTDLTPEQFIRNVNTIHIAIAGQTANLAPADKKLYALRDVTGTVDQMSLIASSIMSKKLASGADGIVLDVKTGDGAFMKSLEDARALAREMVSIGKLAGKDVSAVISDMDQPLGFAVGNALEVKEAVSTLKGHGPKDLEELVLVLGSLMTVKAGRAGSMEEAERLLKEALDIGVTDIESAVIASQAAAADKSISAELTDKKDDIMDIFHHGIIILSVKASDKSFSEFVFDNPNKTAYGVNEALEDIKAALIEQGTEFKTFAYNTDFKDGQGSFSLQTELKPAETDFYYTLVAEGKVIGKAAYLAFVFDRNGDDENTALKFWNGKTLLKD